MTKYLDEETAASDGITIVHEPEQQRFALYRGESSDRTLIGEAHYSFPSENTVDFDHTVVHPEYRGTGLSRLLARRAVTSDATKREHVRASCWFIDGYLKENPELL